MVHTPRTARKRTADPAFFKLVAIPFIHND